MKLNRLIVHGFKSFKDRTTIHFDTGITGIVGPNGCGKSNIVDALFWVMGEQSAKHLRGSSMQDLIFAGSEKHTPANWAEVTLVLGNDTGKPIHIGNKVVTPTEIQLTRKIYKNGETEYRINSIPCRLKDIQEVFMDTGSGAKSYSIIAQGEINRLVQSKPEDRRMIVEDVAGITKFKFRRKESVRKIEQAESNLNRLQDLKEEIGKNLKSLRKQSEKAERAKSLREKIIRYDLRVNSHREYDHLRILRDSYQNLNNLRPAIEANNLEKNKIEIDLQEERIIKTEQSQEIETFQEAINLASRKLAASEERLSYTKKNLKEKRDLVNSSQEMIEGLKDELLERQEKLDGLTVQLEELKKINLENENLEDIELELEKLSEEIKEKQEARNVLEKEISVRREELIHTENDIFKNKSRIEEYAHGLQDLGEAIDALEKEFSDSSSCINDEREAMNSARENLEVLKLKQEKIVGEVEVLEKQNQELDQLVRNKFRDVIIKESKLKSLEELNESAEYLESSVKDFLKADDKGSFKVLGTIINCDEKYLRPIETLFVEQFNSLTCVDTDNNFSNLLGEWTQNFNKGKIDIISGMSEVFTTSTEIIERLEVAGLSDITPIENVVGIDGDQKIKEMFKGYYIVSGLTAENCKQISNNIGFAGIISDDGNFCIKRNAGCKTITISGKDDYSHGVVHRNHLIKQLKEELVDLTQELQVQEQKLEKTKIDFDEIKEQHKTVNTEKMNAEAQFLASKTIFETNQKNSELSSNRLKNLTVRREELSKLRLEQLEEQEALQKSKEDLDTIVKNSMESFAVIQDELAPIEKRHRENNEILITKRIENENYEKNFNSLTQQISDNQDQNDRTNHRILSTSETIDEFNQEIEELSTSVTELEVSNLEDVRYLKDKSKEIKQMKRQLDELLNKMHGRENRVRKLSNEINKAEKYIITNEMKIEQVKVDEDQTVRDTFEKYQVDLRKVIKNYMDLDESLLNMLSDISSIYVMETESGPKEIKQEEYEFKLKSNHEIKESKERLRYNKTELLKLGEINWQAIHDYDDQKVRFNFLQEQEDELKQSLRDLNLAIDHIDKKSKIRFKEAFEQINFKFQKIFPIIFGGGEASLKLMGSFEDHNAGVDIVAMPPGKKMQHLNLMSGGEKALTALSLIFSVFLVKPAPFCLLDEVDAPLDDVNVGRFNDLLREMCNESQFVLITHNKKTMELNDMLYGITMQEPGVSSAVSVQYH